MWRRWFIEKLGGYATAKDAIAAEGGYLTIDDAIEAIRAKGLKERYVILTMAVKRLFNTIDADDILKPAGANQWRFEGKTLREDQVHLIVTEAAQIEGMLLWKVLKKDILYQANKKMFQLAENTEHVVTAKFWLYTFDVMKTRLASIASGSPLFNKK